MPVLADRAYIRPHPGASTLKTLSDLIDRLRRRAYDPAMWLDDAYVPRDWLRRKYGDEAVRKITSWAMRPNGQEEAILAAGAPEAVEFFKDSPRKPAYPPVTVSELSTAEQRMGCRLPKLLRRLYTEVANGGFGPMPGILGITRSGQHDERDVTAVEEYLKNSKRDERLGFPLIDAGCTTWWYVSLTKPGNPVYLFEWDGWDERDSPEVAIPRTAPTLAEWLGRWRMGMMFGATALDHAHSGYRNADGVMFQGLIECATGGSAAPSPPRAGVLTRAIDVCRNVPPYARESTPDRCNPVAEYTRNGAHRAGPKLSAGSQVRTTMGPRRATVPRSRVLLSREAGRQHR